LVSDYRAGASVCDHAARFRIHRATVAQHLDRGGVAMRRRGLDEHRIDQAARLYQVGAVVDAEGGRQQGVGGGHAQDLPAVGGRVSPPGAAAEQARGQRARAEGEQ
jgi:hypothetical protein